MVKKNSDHGRVKKGEMSVVMAIARARLSSAMLPSTTPRIIGARGKPKWRMRKPRMPNHTRVQMSNSMLLMANTPMPQNPRITPANTYMRIRVTSTNTRSMNDCRPSIMKVARKKEMKME